MSSEEDDNALYDAVLYSKKDIVNFFLSKKLEESCEESLLHIAVRKRNLHILEILLQRGADINEKYNDETPIEVAITNEFPEIVESLINNGADLNIPTKISIDKYNHNYSLVHKAVEVGNTEILQFLLKSGVDINPKTKPGVYPQICYEKIDENYEVHAACYYFMRLNNFHVFRRTLTPLEVAIIYYPENGTAILDLLLKNGAAVEIETEEVCPIHLVIIDSNRLLPIAKLLEYGANINSVCESLKYTPLSHAMIHGNSKTVSFLLENGATFNEYTINSVLHDVIAKRFEINSSEKYLTLLLDSGANINSRNGSGKSALHLLISKEFDCGGYLRLLLDYGSDINAKDLEGDTPLHWAIKKQNYAAAEILILYDTKLFVRNDKGDSPLEILNLNSEIFLCRFEIMFRFHGNKQVLKSSMSRYTRSEKIVFLIIQSIILKELRGNYLKEKDLNETKTKYKIVYDFFKKELEELKLRKVKGNLSYYEILTKSISAVETYLNERTIKILEAMDIDGEFPVYARMIKMRLKRIKERQSLLEFCEKRFKSLFGLENELPIIVTEKISGYLTSVDLITLWRIFKNNEEYLSTLLVRRFYNEFK